MRSNSGLGRRLGSELGMRSGSGDKPGLRPTLVTRQAIPMQAHESVPTGVATGAVVVTLRALQMASSEWSAREGGY